MRKLCWNNLKVTKMLTKLKCIYQFFRLFLFLFRRLRHIVSKLNLLFIVKTIFQERVFIFNASLRRINEFNTNNALLEWMRNREWTHEFTILQSKMTADTVTPKKTKKKLQRRLKNVRVVVRYSTINKLIQTKKALLSNLKHIISFIEKCISNLKWK